MNGIKKNDKIEEKSDGLIKLLVFYMVAKSNNSFKYYFTHYTSNTFIKSGV
jgi:hypothetical protein